MYISKTTYALAASLVLSGAWSSPLETPPLAANSPNHWCGDWAGKPDPADAPTAGQQLPMSDMTKRFFVEPQLTNPPFRPDIVTEPKVQVPKFWGNNKFRLALLSYTESKPVLRTYSSSKSRWADFHEAYRNLMTECVEKGTGGAHLVPPSPGLTQGTLVVYAYEIGSKFDYNMNYYNSEPYGINPALQDGGTVANGAPATRPSSIPLVASPPVGYTYAGCFSEIQGRALPDANQTSASLTVLECSQYCAKQQYFGVEFGSQCHCGQKLGKGADLVDGCDTPCVGDKTQVCGGVQKLSVYQKQTQTA